MVIMLSKDQILESEDLETKVVKVPEWGGDVKIASMNGVIREQFEAVLTNKSSSNIRATAAALSIVDDKGSLMFSKGEIEVLGKKSCKPLNRIYTAVMKLNSLESIEKEVKN